MRLVLASGSPRRKELLAQAGYEFEVLPADIDESRHPDEAALAYVQRLALEKAQVIAGRQPDATVIGADTTVVFRGELLNKPRDRADAERMLRTLSGQTHQVHTGLALIHVQRVLSHVETTDVVFRAIDEEELQTYLASGDSLDKAGAYGIQSYAARWITRIDGDYFNVVGLPISALVGLLANI